MICRPEGLNVGFTRSCDILQNYSLDLHQKSPLFPQGPRDELHVIHSPPMEVVLPTALLMWKKCTALTIHIKYLKLFTVRQRYPQSTETCVSARIDRLQNMSYNHLLHHHAIKCLQLYKGNLQINMAYHILGMRASTVVMPHK